MALNTMSHSTALKLLSFVVVSLVAVNSVFATTQVQICHNGQTLTVDENGLNGHFNKDGSPKNGGHENDYRGACETPSVPEFGLLTGALAGAGSVGSYFLLKKRAAKL